MSRNTGSDEQKILGLQGAQPSGTSLQDGASAKICKPDFSTTCPICNTGMQPEHAHYRCLRCGYRDSCCM